MSTTTTKTVESAEIVKALALRLGAQISEALPDIGDARARAGASGELSCEAVAAIVTGARAETAGLWGPEPDDSAARTRWWAEYVATLSRRCVRACLQFDTLGRVTDDGDASSVEVIVIDHHAYRA